MERLSLFHWYTRLQREVERLVKYVVLGFQLDSKWATPTFVIPKKNDTLMFISDFWKLNKCFVCKTFPIPKISHVLQATALELNIGYYTIRIDSDASKIFTIILPWGEYL